MNKKTVVITGGGRGIGRAAAVRFAAAGANIVVNDIFRDGEPKDLRDELEALGAECIFVPGDVSNFESSEQIIKAAVDKFGSVDVLVNNAGITRDNLIIRMSEDEFDKVISVNLKGAFNMTRHAAKVMLKQKSGAIVNLASVAGVGGNVGQANYSASKAGLIGLTKTTASELGSRGITCNAVAPGSVASDMTDVLSDEVKAKMLDKIPLRRFGLQNEVADAIFFLAESKYITGQVLCIDGGMTLL